jgi:DnaK suppressor protein
MTTLELEARRRLEERRNAMLSAGARSREMDETLAALERMDAGTYGRCVHCAGAIGRQRLLALPETRFCVACKPEAAV